MSVRIRVAMLVALAMVATACIPVETTSTTMAEWRQDTPQVASDGVNALIVWRDYRDGSGNGQIYGAIVAPDSSVVVADIAISTQPGTESSPAVVFDGTDYVVAWGDRRGADADLYAARVTTTGQVLDPDGVLVAGGVYDQRRPALASDGTTLLVVYEETSNLPTTGISAKRITSGLTVLDATPIQLATANKDALFPDVVFDGTSFVAGWTETVLDNSDVLVRSISPEGDIGPPIALTSDPLDHFDVTMAFDGTNTMVMYSTLIGSFSYVVHGQRIDPSGNVVDPTPVEFERDPNEFDYTPRSPDVAWDGSSYVLTYTIGFDYSKRTYVVRVDAAGERTSELVELEVRSDPYVDELDRPAIAMVGGVAVVATEGTIYDLDFTPAVFAAAVDGADQTTPGAPLAAVGADQRPEAISYGDGVHLIVWSDYQGRYAARFDDALQPLDATPIPLSLIGAVDVVYNETNFVIVNNGRVVTMGSDGNIVNDQVLPPMTTGGSPRGGDVVSAGGDTLVIRNTVDAIEAVLVDASGNPTSPGNVIVLGDSIRGLSGAWDGSRFHVVWADRRNGDFDIYGTRIASDGSSLDTIGTPIAFEAGDQTDPHIAATDGSVTAIWTTNPPSGQYRVEADRITPGGTPSGSVLEVASGLSTRPNPLLAFSDHFVAVWDEPSGADVNIRAARVTDTVLPLGDVTTATVTTDIVGSAQPALVDLESTRPGVVALLYRDVGADGSDVAFWRVLYS